MNPDFKYIEDKFKKDEAWGLSTAIDIHECNKDKIRNHEYIEKFIVDLCNKILMKRIGDPIIKECGEDEKVHGISFMQLIETSHIGAHFVNYTNNIHLDIFSCKIYNPYEAAAFVSDYFEGRRFNLSYQLRK